MSINYQPPAPVGILAGLSRRQTPAGVPISEMYAAEMQAKQAAGAQQANLMAQDRQSNDHLDAQQRMFAASQAFSPRDQGIAQAQMAEQQQRIQGQMAINQAELTQGENLRLQRLKQGEDAIQQQITDGTVTPAEGKQMLGQLRTPIQVFEARKAASQIKHQDMQNQQLQQQIETQRSVEIRKNKDDEARLQFSAASAEGKLKHIVNPGMATELTAKYSREMPDMPPEAIKQAVEEELMAGGHYSTWFPNEKGVLQQAKEAVTGGADTSHGKPGPSGGEGGASTRGGKGGIPEFDPSRAYHDAESAVDKLLTAGTVKPEDAQAEIQKRYEARKAAHGGYVGERQAAASAGKAAPFNPDDPSTGTDAQKGRVVALKDTLQAIQQQSGKFTPMQTFMMSKAVNETIKLTAKYMNKDGVLDEKELPPIVRKRLEQLRAVLAPLDSVSGGQAPGAGLPTGPLTLEQKQAIAQKLQDRNSGGEPSTGTPNPAFPGQVWMPPHEVVEPGTGRKVMLPARFISEAAVPKGTGERTHEKALRYFAQGLERLRKSTTGEGPSISMGDY